MKSLIFSSFDYAQLLEQFHQVAGGSLDQKVYRPDPSVMEGIYWYLKLDGGIQVFFGDVLCHESFFVYRKPAKEERYVLHFDQMELNGQLELRVGTRYMHSQSQSFSMAYMTSTQFDWHYLLPPNTRVQVVDILLPKSIMGEYLGVEEQDAIFARYLSLRSKRFLEEKMDPLTETFVRDIATTELQHPARHLVVSNRVLLLVERFFDRLESKLLENGDTGKINKDDVARIRKTENILVSDFQEPAPTIAQLASAATMSASKYKSLFKTIYGEGVYEHYQKRRMARAAEMLASGRYKVKDVGMELGYANLSTFSKAFRKIFHVNPSDVKK